MPLAQFPVARSFSARALRARLRSLPGLSGSALAGGLLVLAAAASSLQARPPEPAAKAASAATSKASAKPGRWHSLFAGRDTSAWGTATSPAFPSSSWAVAHGALTTLPAANGIKYDLWSRQHFSFFEFAFEWKLAPGGNTGIKYQVQEWLTSLQRDGRQIILRPGLAFQPGEVEPGDIANEYTRALEFQLMDPDNPDGPKPEQKTGALYGKLAPSPVVVPFRRHGWNKGLLVVNRQGIQHWVNGRQVLAIAWDHPALQGFRPTPTPGTTPAPGSTPTPGSTPAPGPIVLQHHHSSVWFRNLRVRPLP